MTNTVGLKGVIVEERVRVSTEKLKEKSGEWLEMAKSAQRELRNAETIMEKIQTSFYAEPAVSIQKAFEQLTDRGCQQAEELCDHLKKLSQIAESYEEAEKENELAVKDY